MRPARALLVAVLSLIVLSCTMEPSLPLSAVRQNALELSLRDTTISVHGVITDRGVAVPLTSQVWQHIADTSDTLLVLMPHDSACVGAPVTLHARVRVLSLPLMTPRPYLLAVPAPRVANAPTPNRIRP